MRGFLLSAGATVIVVAGALTVITLATYRNWWLIAALGGIALLISELYRKASRTIPRPGLPTVNIELRRPDDRVVLSAGTLEPPSRLADEDVELLVARVISGLSESRSDTQRTDAWALARQSLAATVREGNVAIGGPSQMRQGSVATVAVTISPDPAAGDALRKALSKYEQVSAQASPVSPVMRVMCDGDGFTVKALSAEDQLTIDGATWTFRVRAEQSGRRSLVITVQMRLSTDGTWISRPALSHEVHVTVAPAFVARRFIGDNWQWVMGVALGAAGTITAWQKLF
ncbi:hypothetical protein [Geodermatophilus siccatus]|nr:hypothetical protein [Geodermatophilus siccatus]